MRWCREFALHTVEALAGVGEDALVGALEDAVRVGVLQEHARPGGVQYRFAHAFFRQTLYEELSAARRLRLHQQVARVLEGQYGARLEEHAAELAEHFAHSTDAEDLAKAVRYGELAAGRALAVYAYGEAARLLEQALEVQEVLDPDSPQAKAKRCDLLLALGEGLLPAGEPQRAADLVAEEAFALAEAGADRAWATRACGIALEGLGRSGGYLSSRSPAFRAWAERADRYARPGTVDRVQADLAQADVLTGEGRMVEAWALRTQALEAARLLQDPELLFSALAALLNPGHPARHVPERVRLADEATRLPRAGVTSRTLAQVLAQSSNIDLAAGNRARCEELWREIEELAARTQDANALLHFPVQQALRATLDGDLEAALGWAERVAERGEELGISVGRWVESASLALRASTYLGRADALLRARGDWVLFESLRHAEGALCLAHAGRLGEAEAQFEQDIQQPSAAAGIGDHARALADLLQTALLLGRGPEAADLAGRLEGVTALANGSFTILNVARSRGEAAALAGDRAAARALYERALEWATKVRYRPEVALTRLDLAELLLAEAEGLAHLDFAIEELRAMKMQPYLERALRHKGLLKA